MPPTSGRGHERLPSPTPTQRPGRVPSLWLRPIRGPPLLRPPGPPLRPLGADFRLLGHYCPVKVHNQARKLLFYIVIRSIFPCHRFQRVAARSWPQSTSGSRHVAGSLRLHPACAASAAAHVSTTGRQVRRAALRQTLFVPGPVPVHGVRPTYRPREPARHHPKKTENHDQAVSPGEIGRASCRERGG